jgi:hypothetical protein
MMVAAEYLGRSRLFRRLKSAPHGQLVELYATRLCKDGLSSRPMAVPQLGQRSPELDRKQPFEADRSR